MKNIITLFLVLLSVQCSFGQKKIYLDSLNHDITENEFQKMSEPIKDYIVVENKMVSGEKVISHKIPDSKTLRMIYSEIERYNDAVKAKIGTSFPSTDMYAMDGATFNIKSFANKVVVMNFWFVECAPCIKEMPQLNKLVKEFSTNKDVVFIAPSLSTKQQLDQFVKTREFDFKLTHDARTLLQSDLALVSYPTHFIVDKNGIISYVETTELNENITQSLRAKINDLLKR